jgi:2-polyprenyl-6-methoxyphenol hydroxylase-like FAD-dependent oxidoreductase
MTTRKARHALVLGGGLAGTLAAAAVAELADAVTVIDRDHFPDAPADRKGVPQSRHTHGLVSGGVRAVDALLPGTSAALFEAGAQRIGVPDRYLALGPHGWFPRYPGEQYILGCSRSLLDWTLRSRLREQAPSITYLEGTEVLGLLGDAERVTGARTRHRGTREETDIEADLVVEATGRGSAVTDWLAALGLPAVEEESVDAGIFYATRLFRVLDGAGEDFPAINIQANPGAERVRAAGMVIPIEGGRWSITLSGATGGHPPVDDAGFQAFAESLPHPVIGELTARAEPLGPAFGFAAHANRKRHFGKAKAWPAGFVVVGDAQTTLNPVYGHGMAVAAKSAVALREGLVAHGLAGTRAVQRAIAATATDAWAIATGEDLRHRTTVGRRPPGSNAVYKLQDRLAKAAPSRPAIAAAQIEVITLVAPASVLVKPGVLLDALRGPDRPALTEPPLTDAERRLIDTAAPRAAEAAPAEEEVH